MATATPDLAITPAAPVATRRRPAGWRIIARKELVDNVRSVRFVILLILMGLAGLAAVHSAAGPIREAADSASNTPSIFLFLFTLSPERVPAFHEFIGLLGPLLGIAFGFDAISGERSQRTLPRLASQPVHRDEIITAKFVAGVTTMAVALAALMTIVSGYGIVRLGMVPTGSDLVRLLAFYIVALVYFALWLALAVLLSVVTRRATTAALATIGLWLVLTLFAGLIAGIVADSLHDVPADATTDQVLANARTELNVRRLSPDELYKEATGVLLDPTRQSTGILLRQDADLALPSALPLGQSLLLAWWQVVALLAGTLALIATSFWAFLRQEIRA